MEPGREMLGPSNRGWIYLLMGWLGRKGKAMNRVRLLLASAGFGSGRADASSPTDVAAALGLSSATWREAGK